MAQVSRPFQIALVAVLLILAVWFVALRPKGSSESTQSATPAQSAPSAQSQAQSAAAPTSVYKGSAPGVAGLTGAIAKAHGAVATSQQNAKQLEQNSAKASGETASGSASSAAAPASKASSASKPATSSSTTAKSSSSAAAATAPARQKEVEADLSAGRTAIVLFWDPVGSVDRAVHRQLLLLEGVHHKLRASSEQDLVKRIEKAFALELSVPMSVHMATATEVASFGTITRGVQVLGTPTMLVIAKSGKAVVLTGLTDAYAIQQAIDEARQG